MNPSDGMKFISDLIDQSRVALATKDAEIARLRSEIRQIRQIAEDSSEPVKYRLDSIIDNAGWALDPRSCAPDPAGGMPVEVET